MSQSPPLVYHYLPPLLDEIAQVAGLRAALALSCDYGGGRVYIPARVGETHWLVRCVGREAADKICAHFSATIHNERERSSHGVALIVPLGDHAFYQRARAAAERLTDDGKSQNEIARQIGVSIRTVRRVQARKRDIDRRAGFDGKQGRLF